MQQLDLFNPNSHNDEVDSSKRFDFSKVNKPYVKYVKRECKRNRLKFEVLKSVNNPKSIHGIYPYRGKISALDARQVLSQLPNDLTLLDPFCGSGTIIYEGQKLGMNVVGVDNNPIAVELSRAKLERMHIEKHLNEAYQIIEIGIERLQSKKVPMMPEAPLKHFHEKTASEIMSVSLFLNEMSNYTKGCYFGAIALSARGCNHYKWTSSTVGKNIEPKLYVDFYKKFTDKIKKHYSPNVNSPEGEVYLRDSRELSEFIEPNSIDIVFTSPPYFDALDYTAYYGKIIYEIHQVDRLGIREGLIQSFNNYRDDMIRVLNEIDKVTKPDALIIFVVGDKKAKNGIIDGGEFFSSLRNKQPTYIVERVYSGSQSQIFDTLNKTERKEQIVVWDKSEGF